MSKIINLNGVLIEIDRLKAIIHDDYNDANKLKFVFNLKKEYIFNPNIDEYEIHEFNDEIDIEFPDNNTAVNNYFDIKNIWEEHLK